MKITVFILTFFLVIRLQAEDRLRFRAAAESGLYFHDAMSGQVVSGLNTGLDYRKTHHKNSFRLRGRLTPRFYFEDQLRNLRLSSNLEMQRNLPSGSLNLRMTAKGNFYDGEQIAGFNFFIYQANLGYTHQINKQRRVAAEAGFFMRRFSRDYFNQLSGYSLRFSTFFVVVRKVHLSLGLYTERFLIDNELNKAILGRNPGLRYGPEISFSLRSRSILTLSFLYNLQEYDHFSVTDRNYHLILLMGRYLTKRLTLFLYMNLYQGTSSEKIPWELTYKPISDEHYYYMKFGYDLGTKSELYLKLGYQREEFFRTDNSLSGTQLMTGLAFRL
jgi:hypothetical protein